MQLFKRLIWVLFPCFLLSWSFTSAQFPPSAGQQGSTALHADSSIFVAWSTHAVISRGPQQIDMPSLGDASYGTIAAAIGKADINVISLGDGGMISCYFDKYLINGPGPDFAVFENGFSEQFLELGFVEVSSDGIHFARFPSVSLTNEAVQVGGFGILEATFIHNLAGKYHAFYGTPFDLSEIQSEVVNVDSITVVRVVDVVGSVQAGLCSFDAEGRIINDPWPTPFPSSGFDFDAVGVIHNADFLDVSKQQINSFSLYPNPCNGLIYIDVPANLQKSYQLLVSDLSGKVILKTSFASTIEAIDVSHLSAGTYVVSLNNGNQIWFQKLMLR